jgi:hypothetical protein
MNSNGAPLNDRATACHDPASDLACALDRASGGPDRASGEEERMSVDALSEVLRAVRLQGAVFYEVRVTAAWLKSFASRGSAA